MWHSKIISVNKNVSEPVELSMIVVFEVFPHKNVNDLINSTKRLTVKYEIILVVHSIEANLDAKKTLSKLSENQPNLVTIKLVLMDPKADHGPASRRNIGAILAKSSILLFADDDALVLDDVSSLFKYLQNREYHGIQPLLLRFTNPETVDSAGDFIRKGRSLYHGYIRAAGLPLENLPANLPLEEVPSLRSAFMLIRRDAFLDIGGFDSTFIFNYEDVDLGWRMTAAGYRLLFVPNIRAFHKGGRTTGDAGARNDRVLRLALLNLYAIHLKISPYSFWPYVLIRFQEQLLKYENSKVKQKKATYIDAATDFFIMNKQFIGRIGQAMLYRRILVTKFKLLGRSKLEEMAKGKHFIYTENYA